MEYKMSFGAAIRIVVDHAWEEQNKRQWSHEDEFTEYEQALMLLDSQITAQTDLVEAERLRIMNILMSIDLEDYSAAGFLHRAVAKIMEES